MKNGCRVWFRVDAGPQKGLGQLRRCGALADAFRKEGVRRIGFLTRNPRLVRICIGQEWTVAEIRAQSLKEEIKECRRRFGNLKPHLLILDHYDYTSEALLGLKGIFKKVAYMDDFGNEAQYPVDAVINQNVNAERLSYPAKEGLQLFLGSRYTLIPKDILKNETQHKDQNSLRLFISFGGAASRRELRFALQVFALIRRKVENACAFLTKGITLKGHESLPDGIELVASEKAAQTMSSSNLAISAGGVTSYELAYLGVPAILVVTEENEAPRVGALEASGTAVNAGWIETVKPARLATLALDLWVNRAKRKQMETRSRELIDGQGALRLARDLKKAFLK